LPIFWRQKNIKPKTQLCNFWCQNIGKKCERKMLMKLTEGIFNGFWCSGIGRLEGRIGKQKLGKDGHCSEGNQFWQ